jgi:N-acetylmuramic acid-specific PTS system IIC component
MALAALFLVAVMFGIHQGFVPMYVAMIQDPNIGINILFPVLGLAGASQVGCALAM